MLERLGRRGVVFDNAFATSSWTLPSHGSVFTGQLPDVLSTTWLDPLSERFPTLAERLDSAGYRTGGFVGNLEYASRETGLSRGFAHYEDYPVSAGQLVLSSAILKRVTGSGLVRRLVGTEQRLNRRHAAQINRAFLRWVDRGSDRPFFAFLNYFDAHAPYYPPEPFTEAFRGEGVHLNPKPYREQPPERGAYTQEEMRGPRRPTMEPSPISTPKSASYSTGSRPPDSCGTRWW